MAGKAAACEVKEFLIDTMQGIAGIAFEGFKVYVMQYLVVRRHIDRFRCER